MTPTILFYARLFQLFDDSRLKTAVMSFNVQLSSSQRCLEVHVQPGSLNVVRKRIFKIAYHLIQLGDFAKILLFSGENSYIFKIADLITLCPAIATSSEGLMDRKLRLQQQQQDAKRLRALLPALMRLQPFEGSIFFVNLRGEFQECHVNVSNDQRWQEGKPLDAFISLETALNLLNQIREVYSAGKVQRLDRTITFSNGETRHYQGEIVPVPGTESVIFFCLDVSDARKKDLYS